MRKLIVLVLAALAVGAVGVAQARADASATVGIWAEAGDGSTPAIDQRLADNGASSASTGWGWTRPAELYGGSCPSSGCATRDAGATAAVDEAAGTLKAGARGYVLVGNDPSYGGDAYVTSDASFSDSITLSKPATVLLEGTVHGAMGAFNADDYWLNDPRVSASVHLGFDNGGGPIVRADTFGGSPDGFDQTYEPTTYVACHAAGSCGDGLPAGATVSEPIDDSFSIPVELPAGTTGISGEVSETVDLLVDGEPNVVLAQGGLLDLANTVTFHVVVPNDVAATSESGKLPIVGGAAAADTTPPVTTATVSPVPNAAGWNRGPVTVQLAAADEDGGSGVASITYSATGASPLPETTTAGSSVPVAIGTEGVTALTYHATDAAGNAEALQTLTVRIDGTAPEITVPDGVVADATTSDGASVSYDASVRDNLDPAPSLACEPASGGTFPIGGTTVTCTAADAAGNSATASFTVTVRGAADQVAAELGSSAGGLQAKQQAALADLQAGRTNAACGSLGAYANQVRALTGKKLSESDAASLLATVARVRSLIGC